MPEPVLLCESCRRNPATRYRWIGGTGFDLCQGCDIMPPDEVEGVPA